SALSERILKETDWHVYGMDMATNKVSDLLEHPNFHFFEGDITINKEWIAYHIKKCDVVFPLVAIATPSLYVSDPLKVFELDFEANLEIVRLCVQHKKRVIFPSTSEVYGMNSDDAFDENESNLVTGPINKQRWIYSCSKQLLDRVIYAYGVHNDLDYTLFRPFNWVGPKLDSLMTAKEGSSRVVTQFISDIIHKQEIVLVDGGLQRRSLTDIDDGISALMKIIENKDDQASAQIFNIGNPDNDISIKELALTILDLMKTYPAYKKCAEDTTIREVTSHDHYGKHYQDISRRVPSIAMAKNRLGWVPQVNVRDCLKKTLDYHLGQSDISLEE
ncbi:MAG: bifunctional UDP-4-keto-pentose/UDP-xylose synthase, partial [Alphaproteobacteria bacterium]|nr:bifunctional UDP-4-keto-pentose/UDP-xylose synthase [Alphaproteobacteria bacterium]